MVAFFQGLRGMASQGPNVETQLFFTPGARADYAAAQQDIEREYNEAQKTVTELSQALAARYRETAAADGPVEIYPADLEDLRYRFYRDTWDKLPDFDSLKPEDSGKLDGFLLDLSPATRETAFGFVFEATLIVPQEGDYAFFLASDDGSRASLNGNVVLENDGVHRLDVKKKIRIHLPGGPMALRVDYFQRDTERGLELYWGGPFGHRELYKTSNPRERRPVIMDRYFASDGPRLLGEEKTAQYQAARKRLDELKGRRGAG